MIEIKKSNKADTRTCNVDEVTLEEFVEDIKSHILDVKEGMDFFGRLIEYTSNRHDITKLTKQEWFYKDFKTKFQECGWYKMHQQEERHHFHNEDYIQDDVNLIDILEQITDCVMAGMARSGEYRFDKLPEGLLEKAYENTVKLLLDNVKVVD
jgi:hypothetical protein